MTRRNHPRPAAFRILTALAALSLPHIAQAASDLAVLPQGRYGCWTAGSASGPAVTPQSEFTVVRGSSYESPAGEGTYLLAADVLTFTRGPLKDQRFRRDDDGFWQALSRDGSLGALKCSRYGAVLPLERAES